MCRQFDSSQHHKKPLIFSGFFVSFWRFDIGNKKKIVPTVSGFHFRKNIIFAKTNDNNLLIIMKKLFLTFALACLAICAYAQRDVPVGGCMDVASVESNNSIGPVGVGKQITLYKARDNDGNPSFFLSISNPTLTLSIGTEDSMASFGIPTGGILLDFGTTYDEAMGVLDALLEFFDEENGAQKELACCDGSTVVCTLNKGALGKSISIAETSLSKGNVKSLKTSFKISKKLHKDL